MKPLPPAPRAATPSCPVCFASTQLLGSVDFNKSCAEADGLRLPPANRPVAYHRCLSCAHVFAPEFQAWSPQDFAEHIYNADYATVDPHYLGARAEANLQSLTNSFGHAPTHIRHLDYGGGTGTLSKLLAAAGWNSRSIDPFGDPSDTPSLPTGQRFNLITAIEVFEHHPHPQALMQSLAQLLDDGGVLLVSTFVNDAGTVGPMDPTNPLAWWYCAPRNGHVSLYSTRSLSTLAQNFGLKCTHLSAQAHSLCR
jgi:SAM-dependent methyltransferase